MFARAVGAALLLCLASPAVQAQAVSSESASPFKLAAVTDADKVGIDMPPLEFSPSAELAANFDKYYYFHRPNTDFATAFADLGECDGYASGLSSGVGNAAVPYPYAGTMAGAVGGALGNAMAQAIFGSAEKRRLRRVNMRRCMHLKGYGRYGLPKDLWQAFNFEEGLSGVDFETRLKLLKQQALVASSASPKGESLGL
jgi:hypothetical protein